MCDSLTVRRNTEGKNYESRRRFGARPFGRLIVESGYRIVIQIAKHGKILLRLEWNMYVDEQERR